MKYVFITGATGFIGEHIAQKFVDEGWHVIALVHKSPSTLLDSLASNKLLTSITGDIGDINSFESKLIKILSDRGVNLDVVIHCAAYVSDVGREQKFKKFNYAATISIAEMAKRLQSKLVFISTTDVYGIKDFNGESEENLPFCNNRNNSYPKYKIAAEEWLTKNFSLSDLVVIRPAAVWGLNDRTLTKRIVDFLSWSPFIAHFGKWRGKNRWPLAHVKNVATAAFIAAIEPAASGKAINVLDNEVISVDEFYSMLASIYLPNKKFPRINIPLAIMLPFSLLISTISNTLGFKKPLIDPSIYALFSVSANLDFSNSLFVALAANCNQKIISYTEGVAELIKHNTNFG